MSRAEPSGRTTGRPSIPGEIWVLIGSAFVIAIGFGLIAPVLPAYARSFDVGVAAASVVVSVFAFFRLVFAPAGGALVTRLGERPVYLTGLLVVAASSLATAFAQSYWQLLVFRGLGGLGSTMFTVSAMALLVRLAPPSIRGRVSSAYASAFLLGGMLGPALGGLLASFGLRLPFVVYAAALVVAALVVALRLSGASLRPSAERPQGPPMLLREALGLPAYRAALASAFANGWCNFGVRVAVLPQFAVTVYDRPWVAGMALAVAAVGTALTLQVAGRLADTVGRRPLVIAGLAVTALGFGLLGLSSDLWVLLVLSAVSGLGAGLVNPGQQAAVADVVGSNRSGGSVLAAFQMAQDGGAIVGPILIGVIADQVGFALGARGDCRGQPAGPAAVARGHRDPPGRAAHVRPTAPLTSPPVARRRSPTGVRGEEGADRTPHMGTTSTGGHHGRVAEQHRVVQRLPHHEPVQLCGGRSRIRNGEQAESAGGLQEPGERLDRPVGAVLGESPGQLGEPGDLPDHQAAELQQPWREDDVELASQGPLEHGRQALQVLDDGWFGVRGPPPRGSSTTPARRTGPACCRSTHRRSASRLRSAPRCRPRSPSRTRRRGTPARRQ